MGSISPNPDWFRLEAWLDEALDLTSAQRDVLLERVEREAPALRAQLEALLAADAAAGPFMSGGASAWLSHPTSTPPAALAAGDRIGTYRIVSEIGRGGMGVVYEARRADGEFDQRVALKVVRHGFDSDEMLLRFRRERQILARLEHPSIARIFDGGVHIDGRPYFAMELIDGEPITSYCERKAMPIAERVRLVRRVCDAVQYAHGQLVVHRDLKPSNIFVTTAGELKLLDFGIAKFLTEDGAAAATELTRAGRRLLTPAYAAPEQLLNQPASTAADVYALGVILFELLTGQRPFGIEHGSPADLERAVIEKDPPRPSAVAPHARRAQLAGDLDTIVLKALRKEPQHRYTGAGALAEDLDRHLEGRPVAARPDGRRYRAAKFARRHRVSIAVAALLALSLLGGFAATAWQARAKSLEAQKAEAVKGFLISIFQQADPVQASGRDVALRQVLDRGAERVDRELAEQPEVQGELLSVLAGIYAELGVIDRAAALADQALAIHERLYGPDNEHAGTNLRQKASLAVARGNPGEAEDLARRALAIHRRVHGNAHGDVAEDLDILAMALRQRGQIAAAVTSAEESLAIRQSVLGDEHRLVADSMNNLAVLLREQGRYDDAAALYDRVLTIRRRLLGDEHPHVALALHNYSALQHFRGEFQQAAALSQEAMISFQRLYGDEHQLTLAARSTRAAVDRFMGRLDEAEAGFRTVLEVWRNTAGEDHPNAMVTLGGLARLYRDRGDLGRAAEILRNLDARWRQRMGTEHPIGALIRRQLGGVLTEQGHHDQAEVFLRDALDRFRAVYGESHPDIAETLHELGVLAQARGTLPRAERLIGEALAMRRQILGERHVLTAQSLAAFGAVRLAAGDHVTARQALEQSVRTLERTLPADHPMLVSAAGDLARARQHASSSS